jgi:hypothetical protein
MTHHPITPLPPLTGRNKTKHRKCDTCLLVPRENLLNGEELASDKQNKGKKLGTD